MKRPIVIISAMLSLCAAAYAQPQKEAPKDDRHVRTANYDLAARFSAKKVGQMVYSTSVTPRWFRDSDKFWYAWKTAQGTRYYIVDPASGSRTETLEPVKLAMQLRLFTTRPLKLTTKAPSMMTKWKLRLLLFPLKLLP